MGYELNKGDYYIEDMGCPHTQPKKLPDGYAAIYIFIYQDKFLKIGKANEKSNSSFRPTKHIGKMLNKVTNKFFNSFLFYGIISSINKILLG